MRKIVIGILTGLILTAGIGVIGQDGRNSPPPRGCEDRGRSCDPYKGTTGGVRLASDIIDLVGSIFAPRAVVVDSATDSGSGAACCGNSNSRAVSAARGRSTVRRPDGLRTGTADGHCPDRSRIHLRLLPKCLCAVLFGLVLLRKPLVLGQTRSASCSASLAALSSAIFQTIDRANGKLLFPHFLTRQQLLPNSPKSPFGFKGRSR